MVAGQDKPVDSDMQDEKVHFDRADDEETRAAKRFTLMLEFPFSSSVKKMSTIYYDREQDKYAVVMLKGAVSST